MLVCLWRVPWPGVLGFTGWKHELRQFPGWDLRDTSLMGAVTYQKDRIFWVIMFGLLLIHLFTSQRCVYLGLGPKLRQGNESYYLYSKGDFTWALIVFSLGRSVPLSLRAICNRSLIQLCSRFVPNHAFQICANQHLVGWVEIQDSSSPHFSFIYLGLLFRNIIIWVDWLTFLLLNVKTMAKNIYQNDLIQLS